MPAERNLIAKRNNVTLSSLNLILSNQGQSVDLLSLTDPDSDAYFTAEEIDNHWEIGVLIANGSVDLTDEDGNPVIVPTVKNILPEGKLLVSDNHDDILADTRQINFSGFKVKQSRIDPNEITIKNNILDTDIIIFVRETVIDVGNKEVAVILKYSGIESLISTKIVLV